MSSALSTPGSRWGRLTAVALAATSLAVLAMLGARRPSGDLTLEVRSVPLNPGDPAQTTVGALRFRGGLWLRSADPRFGGLSGLRVSADGTRFLAVSDCGRGLTGSLVHDGRGHLAGVRGAELVELPGPGGRDLVRGELDAEDLIFDDGGLLVVFEGKPPRLWRYGLEPPFAGPPEPRSTPPLGSTCRGNRGPELLLALGEGRLLFGCEGDGLRPEATTLWVGRGDRWTARPYPLLREGWGDSFRPTAATRHPEGGVLVLERRYPPLAARLVHLTGEDLEGPQALAPRELARLEPPLSLDNLEGLDVRRDASGATLLYLISDDNGCAKRGGIVAPRLQRTLLLLFELVS